MLQAALQYSIQKKGVSVLGLPGDLTFEDAVDAPTTSFALPSKSVYRPQDSELKQLAELINSSKKITLFCGLGAKDAHTEVVKLASMIKAPVGYSFKSKMVIQYDNPYEVGITGLLGLPSAYAAMHDAELLILLGTDFPYEGFMPKDCKIVQIDIHPEHIGRRARVEMAMGGDIKDTLKALITMIKEKEDDSFLKGQLKIYSKAKDVLAYVASKTGQKNAIAPEYVASLINKHADKDAIFTVDTGMCCVWAARYLESTGKREKLGSFNHGSMANAMPMAIGAALARPDQQVVALCGDGGISMLLGDLATIAQYMLPIKLVVFNNRSLGMVKLEMEVSGLPDWQTDMHNPDFTAVAKAMGIEGFTVESPDEVEGGIKKAFATDGPVLVNIHTDPSALAMPPKVEFGQMKGFATAMVKLIWNGKIDEVWDTVKSNIKYLKGII